MILKPYKNFNTDCVTQVFHQFHKAIDSLPKGKFAYGCPLVAPERCRIGKIYGNTKTENNDALKNGYGLFMKGIDSGFEHLYWHTLPVMPVSTGDIVEKGTIVAFVGNSGNVISGGVYVPLEDRLLDNKAGTHLHQVITKDGFPFDPLSIIDLNTEPSYSTLDLIIALTKTITKAYGLLKT